MQMLLFMLGCLICGYILIALDELDLMHFIFPVVVILIIGFVIYFIKSSPSNTSYPDSYSTSSERSGGYHMTSDYTRSDGTEVHGYISGNPDGIEENNIQYMEEHGDSNGLQEAYSSFDR
jgi:hypothetical protein